jgi:hypothetical protein
LIVLVAHPCEAFPVELVEADAVGLVGDQQVEHRPEDRQAALLAGEAREAEREAGQVSAGGVALLLAVLVLLALTR